MMLISDKIRMRMDGPTPFEFAIDGNCRVDWKNWLRSFEIYANANQLSEPNDKLNWMLHYAGPKVQKIFYALPELADKSLIKRGPLPSGYVKFDVDVYEEAVLKLNSFFEPKQNVSYERHIFRQMKQNNNERIDVFVMRLREQADRCDFDEQYDDNIRDQVTTGCASDLLRRKILERDNESLEKLIKMAQMIEMVHKQQTSFTQQLPTSEKANKIDTQESDVCKIDAKRQLDAKQTMGSVSFGGFCGRCGLKGHKSWDAKCPARGETCNHCGRKDHFARKCFVRNKQSANGSVYRKRQFENSNVNEPNHKMKRESVQLVESNPSKSMENIEDEYEDLFCIETGSNENKIWCTIGDLEVEVVIDSGSRYNIVDRVSWIEWKAKDIKTIHRQKEVDINFRGYGGHPLKFLGMIKTTVCTPHKQVNANFYVADEFGKVLLGYETAKALGVLKIGIGIKTPSTINTIDASEPFTKIKGVLLDIPIKTDVKGVVQPYRRVPAPLEKRVDEKINELLKQGIIEKVNGVAKWISQLVIAPKDNDDLRICVDMRRANMAIERENHPLPTMDDFLPQLNGAKVFSKLDVKQAYHQVEISPASREITTFMTRKGLYRYTRLMFGITCAPEMFQKLMEQILSGCDGVLIYIDDIVVHAPNKELHDMRLRKVLDRLREFDVLLNKEKCVFGVSQIKFVGHIFTAFGVTPIHDHLSAVRNFREPVMNEEVRSYLGLVNYVGKFIPNLATISEPLRRLTKKGSVFEWGQEQKESFEQLRESLLKHSVLGYYDVDDRTQVIADASPVGLGAVLIQFKASDSRIISFANRSLTSPERNYAQTEKEALALVWAVERFHYFLFGRQFELVTDHKALETLFAPKSKPCARIERWVIRLMAYKFTVVYKPGKTNIADPLSRLIKPNDNDNVNNKHNNKTEQYIQWILSYAEPKAIKLKEIETSSVEDEEIQRIKKALNENVWPDDLSLYKPFESELCFTSDILLRGNRIVIPESLREQIMQVAHEGHPGMSVMKKRLRAKVWWPKIDRQTEEFVKHCRGCTLVSAPNAPEPLRPTELPMAPWEHLAIDFLGPLPTGHYIFVVVDYYSRFVEVEIMTRIDSVQTIKRLKVMFARFGLPISITADNGKQLVSGDFKQYCEVHNIHLNSTTPYWPQMNGEVERQNRSLLKRMIICQEQKGNWYEDLDQYLLMYRSTPHSTTLKTPAEMMFGRNIRDKLPSIVQPKEVDDSETYDRDTLMKEKGKEYADRKRHTKISDIKEGDSVIAKRQMITNKLNTTFEPAVFKVAKRSGSEAIIVNSDTNSRYRRNVSHLKKVSPQFNSNNAISQQPTLSSPSSPPPQPNKSSTESLSRPQRERRPPKRYT